MSKTAIILGSNSDIAKGLMPLLEADGWNVHGWNRDSERQSMGVDWDLLLCCLGTVAPVGLWYEQHEHEVLSCFESNLFAPRRLLDWNWRFHKPGASICFLAGSNPNTIMKGYFAYNVSKMALLKAVEQMDAESPDAKFFALGPGTILTKIHKATLEAKWDNQKLAAALASERHEYYDEARKIQRVYDCLKWCIAQPKEVIGGRNICASDPWDDGWLDNWLAGTDFYKLRRYED